MPGLLVDGCIPAGFPSPADDFDCKPLDLASLLVRHPQATFFMRARGDSMREAGIQDGDLLVVDRAVKPQAGQVVCAIVDSNFTVKYLRKKGASFRLAAANPTYPDIVARDGQTIEVWGVVVASITQHLAR